MTTLDKSISVRMEDDQIDELLSLATDKTQAGAIREAVAFFIDYKMLVLHVFGQAEHVLTPVEIIQLMEALKIPDGKIPHESTIRRWCNDEEKNQDIGGYKSGGRYLIPWEGAMIIIKSRFPKPNITRLGQT